MSRILRNYLISFAIIGLLWLVIVLVNRYVDSHMAAPPTPPGETFGPVAPAR